VYRKNSLLLLHIVVLHYKIITACNTWHIFAFSGAMKQLEEIKSFGSLLASFTSLLYSSDVRVFWLKDRKVKARQFRKGLEGKFFVPYFSAKPFHCSCKRILPFLWSQPNTCTVAEIQSAFSFLQVYSEFEYCSFILSYNGSETLFGRWWNWMSAWNAKYVRWDCAFLGAEI
jgi:hypothetical protein